jgi:hypothetical protein
METIKKVALISSFCNDQEKINVLNKNIDIIKELGLDIIVLSPFFLPKEIVDKCDYFFVTKDNPVYEWPKKGWNFWRETLYKGRTLKISKTVSDYGWAGVHQIKQLNELALNFDYTHYYHLIYDLKITDSVKLQFDQHPPDKIVFPSKRGETIWKVGLHLMIFNKENLRKFNNFITEESYNTIDKLDSSFDWLAKVVDLMPINIGNFPVEDEIYIFENTDIYNYSPADRVKFFIEKNDKTQASIKLYFYEVDDVKVELYIYEDDRHVSVRNGDIVDLNFNKFNFKEVVLVIDNKTYNITDTIKNVKHNTLDIL